ncbi:MAG: ferrochelatase [gamma proteobacterium symbiont of Taylorina sp.]|nr:ferrochelatase [gamma proteobacterium symbiont of Taylorina sp.]
MKFYSQEFKHEQAEKIGILLVNLGSPEAPDASSIRRFLKEFLSDQRVIEMPKFFWQLILNFFILPFRPAKLVPLYQSIWTKDGSPLVSTAQKQKEKLEAKFNNNKLTFALAMRYGQPDIASAMRKLSRDNARKILIFPTYAQYSGTTTAAIFDAVTSELQQWRWVPELRFINQYHDQNAYIQALADSVQAHWLSQKGQKLIMSFHGLPEVYHTKGDPYYCQCHKTARLLAEKLQLDETQWLMTFQSRFGKQEWLKPYTSETLSDLASQGIKFVDIICPGFSIDCLETLEEIAVENRDVFLNAGGKSYHYIPALNDSSSQISAMASLIEQHIQGWEITSDPEMLQQRKRLKNSLLD